MTPVRAALHVHSDWSYDGHLPLAEVAALFARHGYDVVFMCEHDRGFTAGRKDEFAGACAVASAAGALLVPGIEYSDPEDHVHVPVWGSVPFLGERLPTGELLAAVADHGGTAVIAHPRRHDAWRRIEPAWLQTVAGIEIWTRKWDGWAPNPWAVDQARRAGLLGVVSLDLHRPGQMFPLAMELDLCGPLAPAACVEALAQSRARPLLHRFGVAPLMHGNGARAARRVESVRRPVWRRGRAVRSRLRRAG